VPETVVGLDDAPVRAIAVDDVSMWVSDAPVLPPSVTVERVQRHDAVVTAALETGATPLPMRYGQHFDSDDEARHYLEERLVELRPLFARVDGKVEMSVVVAPALKKMLRELEPVPTASLDASQRGAGLGYLQQVRDRTEREQLARSAIDALLDRVSNVVRKFARAEERQAQARGVGVIAHLVDRDDAGAYRAAVEAMRAAKDWQFLVSGPRAPYSFCSIGDGGGGGSAASGTFLAT
jgi:hypothetical protein